MPYLGGLVGPLCSGKRTIGSSVICLGADVSSVIQDPKRQDKIEKVEKTDNRYYRSTSVDLSSWLLVVTNLLQCGIRETNVGTGRESDGNWKA